MQKANRRQSNAKMGSCGTHTILPWYWSHQHPLKFGSPKALLRNWGYGLRSLVRPEARLVSPGFRDFGNASDLSNLESPGVSFWKPPCNNKQPQHQDSHAISQSPSTVAGPHKPRYRWLCIRSLASCEQNNTPLLHLVQPTALACKSKHQIPHQ